ncbi:MAG: hypothetical protein IPM74_18055, partial [Crocinitomicaceae bacterium]|nr:hypothetical protein [Crocinitomicaceae bacterium]
MESTDDNNNCSQKLGDEPSIETHDVIGSQKFRLELKDDLFSGVGQFKSGEKFHGTTLLESTNPSDLDEMIIPSIYLLDNNDFEIVSGLAISGLMLIVLSFDTKVAFCVEA